MGSAVVKPLTRRRGKIKKNKVAVDPANGSEEENATRNCRPSEHCKVNSLAGSAKNLRQPYLGKSRKVDVDKSQSSRKVCCTNIFFSGRPRSYDSDEELSQIQLVRKNNVSPSQTNNSQHSGTRPSEISRNVNVTVPSVAPPSAHILPPSRVTQPDTSSKVNRVSSKVNTLLSSSVQPQPTDCILNEQCGMQEAELEDSIPTNENEVTEVSEPHIHDVSRDARTPSPEYDDLEDLRIINRDPSSTEPCAASSPFGVFEHPSATRMAPTVSNIALSFSKTQQSVSGSTHAQSMDVGHSDFIKPSLSKECMENQYQGAGEPFCAPNYSRDVCVLMSEIEARHFEMQCAQLDYEKHCDRKRDFRNVSLCKKSPTTDNCKSVNVMELSAKLEEDLSLECNENKAIHSTHSFGDAIKETFYLSRSARSSKTSLNGKDKQLHSEKGSDTLSINHPLVEEVLAIGEEFVDEINEDFLQQDDIQSPDLDGGKCLTPIQESEANENTQSFSLHINSDLCENKIINSPRSSEIGCKNSETIVEQLRSRPASALSENKAPSSRRSSVCGNRTISEWRRSRPGSGICEKKIISPSSSVCGCKASETNLDQVRSRPASAVCENKVLSSRRSSELSIKHSETIFEQRISHHGAGVFENNASNFPVKSVSDCANNEIWIEKLGSRQGSDVSENKPLGSCRSSELVCKNSETKLEQLSSRPGSGECDNKTYSLRSYRYSRQNSKTDLEQQTLQRGSSVCENKSQWSPPSTASGSKDREKSVKSRPGSTTNETKIISSPQSSATSNKIIETDFEKNSSRPGSASCENKMLCSPQSSAHCGKNVETDFGRTSSRSGENKQVKSPHSLTVNCKISETNFERCSSRPGSSCKAYGGLSNSQQADNIKAKPISRPSSQTSEQQSYSITHAVSENKPPSARRTPLNSEHGSGPMCVEDLTPRDNREPSRISSSKESLHSTGTGKMETTSGFCRQSQSSTNRANTPGVSTSVAAASSVFKISCRPPSSKRSTSSLDQNHRLPRPGSSKRSATSVSDSAEQINTKPRSVSSRHSSVSSRPPSSLGKLLPPELEMSAECVETVHDNAVLTGDHTSSDSMDRTGGAALNVNVRTLDSGSKSPLTSPAAVVANSKTEVTAVSSVCSSKGSTSHCKIETPADRGDGLSSFDQGRLNDALTSAEMKQSSSKLSVSSKRGEVNEHGEVLKENLETPKEATSPSYSFQSSRTDCGGTDSMRQTKSNGDGATSLEASWAAALAAQPSCLSPDKIGNIRRQLYEEGLKPAEREGGVAFFIPVTEDGLQPQIDGAVVAERLTKTKKASLNYEERMFLANINRQVQLSKKKEFAIRDIRNVKGATPSSDGSDRTKQNDDADDFDVSF